MQYIVTKIDCILSYGDKFKINYGLMLAWQNISLVILFSYHRPIGWLTNIEKEKRITNFVFYTRLSYLFHQRSHDINAK